jgi:hypothetical protein
MPKVIAYVMNCGLEFTIPHKINDQIREGGAA